MSGKPYRELYLPHPHDLDGALCGFEGRAAFEQQVRLRPDLPLRVITPVTTRFSRGHVAQLGGDPANNTVLLAPARQGDPPVERVLGWLNTRYKPRMPILAFARELDEIERDYPEASFMRTMAAAFEALIRLWVHQQRAGETSIPLQLLDQLVAEQVEPWARRRELLDEIRSVDSMSDALFSMTLPSLEAEDRRRNNKNWCDQCGRCCDCRPD